MKSIHFEEIDSTNTYLKNNYQKLDDLTFVSASKQTQGRGRNNRSWISEDSNVLFSILLKDQRYFNQTNSLSIISAYTVIEVLKEYGVNDLSIKWPNDVYAGGKKICGILLEAISKQDIECLVIGVGINVNQEKFIGNYMYEPTSVFNEVNKKIDIESFKDNIYKRFIDNFNKLLDGYDYYYDIVSYNYLKDKEVYALIGEETKKVLVKRINRDYSLCVVSNDKEINLNSGEISFHIK